MKPFNLPEGTISLRWAVILSTAACMVLSGCARTQPERDVRIPHSGFLPDYSLLEPGPTDGALLVYMNPKADWRSYQKVLVDPVLIWSRTDAIPDATPKRDLRRLAGNFYRMITRELAKDYEIVEAPAPSVLRIQVALTNIEQTTGAVDVTGAVDSGADRMFSGNDFATGKPLLVGDVNAEYKIIDARTGQILAMGIDRNVGSRAIERNLDTWDEANTILASWSKHIRYKLCRLRAGADCFLPKW